MRNILIAFLISISTCVCAAPSSPTGYLAALREWVMEFRDLAVKEEHSAKGDWNEGFWSGAEAATNEIVKIIDEGIKISLNAPKNSEEEKSK